MSLDSVDPMGGPSPPLPFLSRIIDVALHCSSVTCSPVLVPLEEEEKSGPWILSVRSSPVLGPCGGRRRWCADGGFLLLRVLNTRGCKTRTKVTSHDGTS